MFLRFHFRSPTHRAAGLLVAAALAGCGRNDIKVYEVATQPASSPPPGQAAPADAMPPGHPDLGAPARPRLAWKTPKGWNEAAPGQMRVASFSVKGVDGKQADVSVIPLAGDAGGDAANVNRWRGQAGLEPVSADEIKKLSQNVEVAGQPSDLYEIAGKNPASGEPMAILSAIAHRGGTAWFFKMTGDGEVVTAQKPAFVEFLKSVTFEAGPVAAVSPGLPSAGGMELPSGHPDVSPMAAGAGSASSEGNRPGWQVPLGWQEAPAGQFLVAKFIITGEGGAQAAVNVSASAGDGGGLAANINRWRKQLGLDEMPEADVNKLVTPVAIAGGNAMFVDLSGTDARSGQPARLVGAMVPQAGQAWFYKLMGNPVVVQAQ